MEEFVEIPSNYGITFNVQPKMKAVEIAEKARDAILSLKFHQVHVNLPNGDMVGHTGDIEAIVVAFSDKYVVQGAKILFYRLMPMTIIKKTTIGDIMILPVGARKFEEAMQMGSETYHHLKVTFF
ncbi:phosphoglycerate mutase (2,3-diphosphoglycerate-independent) [Sarracenia purpurea var. burkii]